MFKTTDSRGKTQHFGADKDNFPFGTFDPALDAKHNASFDQQNYESTADQFFDEVQFEAYR